MGSVWSIGSIRSVWFIYLVWFNQTNETDQRNQIDQIARPACLAWFLASCQSPFATTCFQKLHTY